MTQPGVPDGRPQQADIGQQSCWTSAGNGEADHHKEGEDPEHREADQCPLGRVRHDDDDIEQDAKMHLVQSCAMTKLEFNAAIWPVHEFKIMNTALNRTYGAAKNWNCGRHNHDTQVQVMIDLTVPTRSMLLVSARRLYLPQLLRCGPNILFALLRGVVDVQHSWHGMSWPHKGQHACLGKRWLRQIAGEETEKRRSSAALPGQGPSSQGHIEAERPTRTVSRSQGRGKRVDAPRCRMEPGCKSPRQRFTRRWKHMVVLASTCV